MEHFKLPGPGSERHTAPSFNYFMGVIYNYYYYYHEFDESNSHKVSLFISLSLFYFFLHPPPWSVTGGLMWISYSQWTFKSGPHTLPVDEDVSVALVTPNVSLTGPSCSCGCSYSLSLSLCVCVSFCIFYVKPFILPLPVSHLITWLLG